MRKFLFILCTILAVGCVADVSPDEEYYSDDVTEDSDMSGYPGNGGDHFNPCNVPDVVIMEGPDGETYYMEIPTLCARYWFDFGDPPPEQVIDPYKKVTTPDEEIIAPAPVQEQKE